MRRSCFTLALIGLGACAPETPAASSPPSGQWMPPQQQPYYGAPAQQPYYGPPPQPQLYYPPQPQPYAAPQPTPAQQYPWPFGTQPWPGGFPQIPGWSPPAQPAQQQLPTQGGDVAQRCVDDINRYRATKGLAPLARWFEGEACASAESAEDSRSQQAHGSFGRCQEHAQNACPNWPGPPERMIDQCLQSMWNEGPGQFPEHGHYMNMVDTRSTKVACGMFTMPNGSMWAVQDFR